MNKGHCPAWLLSMRPQTWDLKASALSPGLQQGTYFRWNSGRRSCYRTQLIYKKTCHSFPSFSLWPRMCVAGSQVLFTEAFCLWNSLPLVVQQSQSLASFVRPDAGCICFLKLLIKVFIWSVNWNFIWWRGNFSCANSLTVVWSTGTCRCQ